MALEMFDKIMKQTSCLSAEEQLILASRLIERTRQSLSITQPQYKWRNLRGVARGAKLGEDTQAYIICTRVESDAHRDQNLDICVG